MLVFQLNTGALIEWHVGEKRPDIFQPKRKAEFWPNGEEKEFPEENYPVSVTIDGGERYHISHRFMNLPQIAGRIVIYRGDLARFIYDNLV